MRRTLQLFTILVFLLSIVSCAFAAPEVPIATANPEAKSAYTGPVWAPNGKSLAYVGMTYTSAPSDPTFANKDKSIYVATPVSGKWTHRAVAKSADWPVWSPDSKQLLVSDGGLVLVDAATGKSTRLTKDLGVDQDGNFLGVHQPLAWSPTGKHIMYQNIRQEGVVVRVRDIKTGKELNISEGGMGLWMDDGKLLAAQCTSEGEPAGSVLKVVDPATGTARTVLKDQYVRKAFIPKGAGYAWVWLPPSAPKGEGVYKVDLKTGVLSKLIAVRAKEMYFSPDAKQFAFFTEYSPKAGVEPKSTLYIGETKNWSFKIASKEAGKTEDWRHPHANWAPDSKSLAYVNEAGDIKQIKL